MEEAPQEPVPETEDVPPPETEDAVPPVQETTPRMAMPGEELFLHCTAEGLKFLESGLVPDSDVTQECIVLPAAFISLLVIVALLILYVSRRRGRQADHKGTMPSGRDRAAGAATGDGSKAAKRLNPWHGGIFRRRKQSGRASSRRNSLPTMGLLFVSSQKAAGGGFPQKKPQSGHRTDSSSLSKPVETAPTQKRKPAVKAAASAVPEAPGS